MAAVRSGVSSLARAIAQVCPTRMLCRWNESSSADWSSSAWERLDDVAEVGAHDGSPR